MKHLKYLPLLLFFGFAGKFLFTDPSFGQAIVFICVSSIAFLYQKHSHNEEIKILTEKVNSAVSKYEELEKKIDDTKTQIASVKLSNGFRGTKLG